MDTEDFSDSAEADFHNSEIILQYKNEMPIPFLIENYMLSEKVNQVKLGILSLKSLQHVTERPEELKLYLVTTGDSLDEEERQIEMDEGKKLNEYLVYFGTLVMLKLLPR